MCKRRNLALALSAALLLVGSTPAVAQFTKAQTEASGTASSGTTVAASLASNATAGRVVVIRYTWYDGLGTAPNATAQDENGKTYTIEAHNTGTTNISSAGYLGQGYYIAASGAGKTVTVTFDRATAGSQLFVDEFAPPGGGTITYDSGACSSGTDNVTGPSIPVASANELIVAVGADSDTLAAVTGAWTLGDVGIAGNGSAAEHQLNVSAATSAGFTGTAGQVWNACGMSFKSTGGGAALPGQRAMMGVGQ